jgi:deoxyribose-phosphate aldolase
MRASEDLISKIVSELIVPEKVGYDMPGLNRNQKLAAIIDHTILQPDATEDDIRRICEETRRYGFATVCVHPCWVPFCASLNADGQIKICSVVGFPLGNVATVVKAAEAGQAVMDGAHEIDMVMNVSFLKSGKYDQVEEDIRRVVRASQERLVKVIIETCLLSDEEKVRACLIAKRAGAAFVKTSTGFNPKDGAKVGDVALMRKVVGPDMGVKASGGIRTNEQAMVMIDAGADRIGTSSSLEIIGVQKNPSPTREIPVFN